MLCTVVCLKWVLHSVVSRKMNLHNIMVKSDSTGRSMYTLYLSVPISLADPAHQPGGGVSRANNANAAFISLFFHYFTHTLVLIAQEALVVL